MVVVEPHKYKLQRTPNIKRSLTSIVTVLYNYCDLLIDKNICIKEFPLFLLVE